MVPMTDASLQDEVERLRAENAALERRVSRRIRLRAAASWLLLVLGCGLAVLSLVAVWLRVTLLDTDRYVDTVAPIAADPAVQDAVADKLETAIYCARRLRRRSRARCCRTAPTCSRRRSRPASRRSSRTGSRSSRARERFQDALDRGQPARAHARRGAAHRRSLGPPRARRRHRLSRPLGRRSTASAARCRSAGWTGSRARSRRPSTAASSCSSRGRSSSAQRGVRLLKAVAIVLPLLALLCLVGSVFLARQRRRGVLRAGIGLAVAMLLLIAALAVARSAYLDALDPGALPPDAASSIFDTRRRAAAPRRPGRRRGRARGGADRLRRRHAAAAPVQSLRRRSSRRLWIATHRRTLMLIAGGLGLLRPAGLEPAHRAGRARRPAGRRGPARRDRDARPTAR